VIQHMCSNNITDNEDNPYPLRYMIYHLVKDNKSQWCFMEIITHIWAYSFIVQASTFSY